jgi:hypothetical protein
MLEKGLLTCVELVKIISVNKGAGDLAETGRGREKEKCLNYHRPTSITLYLPFGRHF